MVKRRDFIKTAGITGMALSWGGSSLISKPLEQNIFNKDILKDLQELNDEDFLSRQNTARKWMEKFSMDAIFVEGGVNMSYFTDTSWWMSERLFGFVLSHDYDPIWICPAFELKRAKELIRFGTDIRVWEEHESPFELFNGIMKSINKPYGKLGIGPNVRNFIADGIRKAAKFEVVSGAPITEYTRAIKTEKELSYLEAANKITKLAYQEGFNNLSEGMEPRDLQNVIREAHGKLGVSGSGGPLFGHTSAFPHGTREKITLNQGDIVLVDGGCSVNGFRSDVTRTIVFGKPSERQKTVWNVVREAQEAAFRLIRQGLPCAEADLAARKVVEKAGFGSGYETFTHRLGHGIGMEGHEFPYLVNSNKMEMLAGMTFTNEPGIYLYGEFGVRIEDSFAVTENGVKVFGDMLAESIDKPFG